MQFDYKTGSAPPSVITVTKEVGGWTVEAVWRIDALSGGPTEIHITPQEDVEDSQISRGITTGTLRQIPLTEMMDEVRQVADQVRSTQNTLAHAMDTVRTAVGLIREAVSVNPRPGRAGRNDTFYALVALIYVTHAAMGDAKPLIHLAGLTDVGRATAEKWIRTARERELLGTPRPGAPNGDLTPKAHALLTDPTERN